MGETPSRIMDPAQAAWAKYLTTAYLGREDIEACRRAFIAGWNVGWSDGFETGFHDRTQEH